MERQGVRITPDDFEKHMLQLEEEVRSTCCSRKKSEKDMLQLEEEVQSIHMCRVGQNLVLHS